MALTPEDVVNKRFQPTKFREGYDQDEVDDFLDEVVVELRRLTQENDELRQRLARHEDGADASGTGGTSIRRATTDEASGTDATSSDATVGSATGTTGTETTEAPLIGGTPGGIAAPDATADTDTHAVDTDATATGADSTPDADTAVPATSASPVTASAGTTPAADNAAGLLAMAQRIHDEYVNSGIEQRDSIIAEAQSRAETMVNDAETHRTKTLADLEQQKSALETQVDELRGFERDYRSRLKDYIESQLHDLETTGSVEHRPDAV